MTEDTALEANKRVVERLILEGVNQQDEDLIRELIADDFVDHSTLETEKPLGSEGFLQIVRRQWDTFPDLQLTIEDMIAEGDQVAFRDVVNGTHEGPRMGLEPTGNKISYSGILIYRLENGQIVERWSQTDEPSLYEQLGGDLKGITATR